MSTEISDDQLIERIRAGDRESYGVLASRHRQKLHRVAQRYVGNAADAEDAVQSAHLLALRHFDQYRGPSAYTQWMASITRNEIRMRQRQNRLPLVCLDIADATRASTPSPEDAASYLEMRKLLADALERLTPAYRHVFLMRALAELSTAQTGKTLGISEASVKMRLRRARLMLRDIFERRTVPDSLRSGKRPIRT